MNDLYTVSTDKPEVLILDKSNNVQYIADHLYNNTLLGRKVVFDGKSKGTMHGMFKYKGK